MKAINTAKDILASKPNLGSSNFIYLERLLTLRKIETSRRLESVYFDNFDDMGSPIDARSNYVYGAVLRSKA